MTNMDLRMFREMMRILIFILAVQMFSAAAAELRPPLTCTGTRLPNGTFLLLLSRPTRCKTCWEDNNNTVIARDLTFDPGLALHVTDQSLVLKSCQEYTLHTNDCPMLWEDAVCHMNCSLLEQVKALQPPTVNSTLICISADWCLKQTTFWLGIAGILLLAAAGVALFLYRKNLCKRKRRQPVRASYNLEEVKLQIERDEKEEEEEEAALDKKTDIS